MAASTRSPTDPFFVRFYDENTLARDARGRNLHDILRYKDEELEYHHDYIQILFPLPEGSPFNPSAPIINRATFEAFGSRKELRDQVRLAFRRMLKFYGLSIAPDGGLILDKNWDKASRNWVKGFNHNHLRITRIIRSLRVLGLETDAVSFFQALAKVCEDSGKISGRSLTFWTRAAKRPLYLAPEDEEDNGNGVDFLYEIEACRNLNKDYFLTLSSTDFEERLIPCPAPTGFTMLFPESSPVQEHTDVADPHQVRSPYRSLSDYLSNVSTFSIIESTLREGEQFANAFFDTDTKVRIARALDAFGVEYIELTNPVCSEQSRKDCEIIAKLGLRAKILTHVRCNLEDARVAVKTGVAGVDVVIGTSKYLIEHSHGKGIAEIIRTAKEVIQFVKSHGLEIRFSTEDSFRSNLEDLLSIYSEVDKIGVTRVGIADTVGVATGRQVYDLVSTLRGVVHCEIECHFHNDTGCAIANAFSALEAGATHVDTSVLGIGERNGIPSLGGFVARMLTIDREYVKNKYDLTKLKALEDLVASAVEVNIPFNNPVTGMCAFTHKAGIHAKAVLANPSTYEIIDPEDFGMTRYIDCSSSMTGCNVIKSRCEQLQLSMTDAQIKQCTGRIKAMGAIKRLTVEDTDAIIKRSVQRG
ncbi:homocitrate synthase, partial [Lecanoromycetidae sp. Uapishka_2]